MKKTNIRCYLSIGHLQYFTDAELLRIETALKAKNVKDYKFFDSRVDSSLELFDTGKVESLDVESQVLGLLNILKSYFSDFASFCNSFEFSIAIIRVVIEINDDMLPAIIFSKPTIAILNQLHVEIDIDMYNFTI